VLLLTRLAVVLPHPHLLQALPTGSASLWVMLFHGGIAAHAGPVPVVLGAPQPRLHPAAGTAAATTAFIAGTGYKALGALSAARIADSKALTSGKKTN